MSNGNGQTLDDLTPEQKSNLELMLFQRRSWLQIILAIGVMVAFFSMLALLLFHQVPSNSEDMFDIMLGTLGSSFTMIVTFYFTSGAQRQTGAKDQTTAPKTVDTTKS